MLRGVVFALVALGPLAVRGGSGNFDAPFQVDADEVEYQTDRDLYVARGHVVIHQESRTLRADRVYFSSRTHQGVASGDVVIEDGKDVLHAPFLQFSADISRGLVLDGELDSPGGGYRMRGQEVRKTGEHTYEFVGAHFTTCRCPDKDAREPWAVEAKQTSLDLDGYGRARNSTLSILGVPVLWLPYAVYPLKRDRQTGFLFPGFGTSGRTGGDVTLPFFWAVADNVSAELEAQYQVKRGFKPSATVEYVYGETAEGKLYGTFIDDKSINPSDFHTPFGSQRWGVRGVHREALPFESRVAVDAITVSDNQFPLDFADFRRYTHDRFLRSTGFADTHFGSKSGPFALTLAGQSSDDLQNPDDQDRDQWLLQRLPALQGSVLPAAVPHVPGLVVSSNVELVNFQPYGSPRGHFDPSLRVGDLFYDTGIDAVADGRERNNSGQTGGDFHHDDAATVHNGPEGDRRFEEGEPLADHGQRLLANPRIAYPFHLGDLLEIYPEAGYSGAFYNADLGGVQARSLFTGRLDLRMKLRGNLDLPGLAPLVHVAEPFVGWVGISHANQDGKPLFVPTTAVPQNRLRLLEPDNWTLDPADRVNDANNVVFGVENRFWGQGTGALQGEITVASQYLGADGRWGIALIQGDTTLPGGLRLRMHGTYDLPKAVIDDGLTEMSWGYHGHELVLGYRYVRDIPQVFEDFVKNDRFKDFQNGFNRINQISGGVRIQATHNWTLTYNGSYSFENTISLLNLFGVEYLSKCHCWAARFEVSEDRARGFDWNMQYRLIGLGEPPNRLFSRGQSVSQLLAR